MPEYIGSCSAIAEGSYSRAWNPQSDHHNTIKSRETEYDAKAAPLNTASPTGAMSIFKGKQRQCDVSSPPFYPSASLHTQGKKELLRIVGNHKSSQISRASPGNSTHHQVLTSKGIREIESQATTISYSDAESNADADADVCRQCIDPAKDLQDPTECCTSSCPISCSAPPQATCSANDIVCCNDSEHLLDIKPTLITCQGADCADEAVIMCSDAECAAPSKENFGECPSTCMAFTGNTITTAELASSICPSCDDDPARSYSSFQELLDCWCCADSDLIPCGSKDGSPCPSLTIACDTCCNEEPLPPLLTKRYTPVPRTLTRSRDTSTSVSTLQSSSMNSLESLESSIHNLSKQWGEDRESRKNERLYTSCLFEGFHRHNDRGMCLPPNMTLNNHQQHAIHEPFYPSSAALPTVAPIYTCHWAGCGLQCGSVTELASHVNSVHLTVVEHNSNGAISDEQASAIIWRQEEHALKCLWDSCQVQVSIPDTNWQDENLILEHILQAHVGIDDSLISSAFSHAPPKRKREVDQSPDTASISATECKVNRLTPDDHEYKCRWKSCSKIFPDHEGLTDHITNDHVGSGKAQYTCEWEDCTRENRNFYQKQKILRHLQTHTGYRPYLCDVCQKRFSEPSTLAQHQRTHTKEKPYFCDYEGCGKCFAVAASLTIHKRVHTGEKPFKCKWPGCEIAFSESSNLRKHMRIHTGERPFRCTQEGCSKNFSRPDQLARHRKTHQKKEV